MKLIEFCEKIYFERRIRADAYNTRRLYKFSVRNLDRVLGRTAMLSDLTDETIALVMRDIMGRGGSPASANKERAQLLALWRFAARLGKIECWPTIAAEREPERVPKAWLASDIGQLFDTVETLQGRFRGTAIPERLWWKAILGVCLDTGERIGAVSKAEWDWLERDWILFPAEARKGKRRDRRFQLSADTVELLSQVRSYTGSDRKIFVWPYTETYIWTKYGKLLKRAGLPHGARDKFHRLRKTVASVAHACGLNAQELLDHQHRSTTQAYLDPRFTRQEQVSTVFAKYLADPSICHLGQSAQVKRKTQN